MTRFVVGDDAVGERLDVALAALLDVSRSRAASLVDDGHVQVDGRAVPRSTRLARGQRIDVAAPVEATRGGAGVPVPPVRYEDEHVLVIAKPAGLVVHPGTGNPDGTLVQVLRDHGYRLAPAAGSERPGIVHRLDRDTSGLLAIAKSDDAYHALVAALRDRRVGRRYLALVEGEPPGEIGRVEAPIGRDPTDRKRYAAVATGKPATTHWRQLASGLVERQRVTLLACRLETGRTHQIRVHLSFAGTPVVGDRTYGASRAVMAALGLERPFLHAARLTFAHPVTGEEVTVDEPLPDDLIAAAARAGIDLDDLDTSPV